MFNLCISMIAWMQVDEELRNKTKFKLIKVDCSV